ncbi:MAG: DUF2127 domain-containing protein [Streptosporangiales bacterium]|nr:DUF2127 domain-containing protein [Streptosporangiales bacterium]
MDWSVLGCWRSHVTYAPDEPHLHARLRAHTATGDAWRCLRCGTYVPGPAQRNGPAATAPAVRRGRELRDAILLRVLAVERALRGLVMLGAAYAVWTFRGERPELRRAFEENLPLLRPLADELGWQLTDSALVLEARHLLDISQTTLLVVAIVLVGYAATVVTEGVGLWLLRRWGEYFAVVATAAFVPFEVYELVRQQTALRIVALVLNVAVVLYIVWSKRLFGFRGGGPAYERERRSEAILTT